MLSRIFASQTGRTFRRFALVAVSLVALSLQLYLVLLPLPVAVAPVAWAAQHGQEVMLKIPDPKQFVLSHISPDYAGEHIHVIFEKARLAPETLSDLKSYPGLGFVAPSAPAVIKYTTRVKDSSTSPAKKPCKTSIDVNLKEVGSAPAIVHLFQKGEPEDHPYLEMMPEGAGLAVALSIGLPENGDEDNPGCRKSLWINGREYRINTLDISVVAEPGSSVRFHFYPLDDTQTIWENNSVFTPFTLGKADVDTRGIGVSEFGIRSLAERPSSQNFLLAARSTSPTEASLRIEKLIIGQDEKLHAHLTGRGLLSKDNVPVRGALLTRLSNHFPLVTLFAGIDAFLLFAFSRLFRRGASESPVAPDSARAVKEHESEPLPPDLRERMTERMSRSEVGTVWFDLLQTSMDSDMAGRPYADCVIELLERVHHRDLLPRLLESLRHSYPHVLNP